MFSIAVTWLALSPSNLPAALISVAPLADASFCAPSFILTKNGLVSVLVIRPTLIFPAELPPDGLDLAQADSPRDAAVRRTTRNVEVDFQDMTRSSASVRWHPDRVGDGCQRWRMSTLTQPD